MKGLTFLAQLSLDFIFAGVEHLPDMGQEVMAQTMDIQLGGGTLVYPIVLHRLGVPTRVVVKSNTSRQASFAMELLKTYGLEDIVVHSCPDYDPVMSTAVISLSSDRSFVSKNDEEALKFDDKAILDYYKESKIIFATEKNLHLLKDFREHGHIIVFDIGWSDDLTLDKYKEVLSYVDYFTPNDKEAMKMTNAANVEESLQILSRVTKHPVVSCGKDGCKTTYQGKIIHVPVPKSGKVIDTTGAGDNFMAGLIYGIYHDKSLEETMQWANATGALSTEGLGCYGRNYTFEEVKALVDTY